MVGVRAYSKKFVVYDARPLYTAGVYGHLAFDASGVRDPRVGITRGRSRCEGRTFRTEFRREIAMTCFSGIISAVLLPPRGSFVIIIF